MNHRFVILSCLVACCLFPAIQSSGRATGLHKCGICGASTHSTSWHDKRDRKTTKTRTSSLPRSIDWEEPAKPENEDLKRTEERNRFLREEYEDFSFSAKLVELSAEWTFITNRYPEAASSYRTAIGKFKKLNDECQAAFNSTTTVDYRGECLKALKGHYDGIVSKLQVLHQQSSSSTEETEDFEPLGNTVIIVVKTPNAEPSQNTEEPKSTEVVLPGEVVIFKPLDASLYLCKNPSTGKPLVVDFSKMAEDLRKKLSRGKKQNGSFFQKSSGSMTIVFNGESMEVPFLEWRVSDLQ